MKTKLPHVMVAFIATIALQTFTAFAQGTAFTYQGRLNDGANPANGNYDLRFAIYDAASSGAQQGNLLTNSPTGVTNGLFTVTLDFGNQFPGADRWLEIAVRTNGGGAFSTLAPRQALTATPYAITAGSSSNLLGTVSPTALAGTYSSPISFTNTGNSFSGAFAGNGAGLTNLNAWQLGGNAGTTPGTHFIGTTDNQPLEIKVNGQRAMRLVDNPGMGTANIIGGSSGNNIDDGVIGATIGGGGTTNYLGLANVHTIRSSYGTISGGSGHRIDPVSDYSVISGGSGHSVATNSQWSTISGGTGGFIGNDSEGSTVGGGYANQIKSQSSLSTIGGGYLNSIGTNSGSSTLAGGFANHIQTNSANSTISGGGMNRINDGSTSATISGGANNLVGANAGHAVISGGQNNVVGVSAGHAVIGGGFLNNIGEQAGYATISGGTENTIEDSANYSTVGGGSGNIIKYSTGSSVIGGGGGNVIYNNCSYVTLGGGQFNNVGVASAWAVVVGGYGNNIGNLGEGSTIGGGNENTISASARYATIPGGSQNQAGSDYAFAAGRQAKAHHQGSFVWGDSTAGNVESDAADSVTFRASGGYRLFSNSTTNAGVSLAPGGTSWAVISDKNAKKDFVAINAVDILEKLSAMPITQWRYNWEAAETTPHIGPMAQDFKAAFYPGSDDKSITTLEADGVAFAAIQGLNQKLKQKESEIAGLQQQLNDLKVLVKQLAQERK